jgi:hypothetical protein
MTPIGTRLIGRRHFLRGAGGVALALPFLPSLLTSNDAEAQDVVGSAKCFVHFRTPHGGVATSDMWPADAALTETLEYTHAIRRGALVAEARGADAVITPVLTAAASVLTPAIVAKMNLLRGLDIAERMDHNFGGALGYFDFNKGRPADPRATIDQVMAHSPAFYPSVATVRRRSVAIAHAGSSSGSYGYVTPGVRSSGVAGGSVGGTESSQGLFATLLDGVSSEMPSPSRPPVVDQILESYRRLRNGTRRLSREDRVRVDQHIDAVAELERRLSTGLSAGCVVPPPPSTDNIDLRPMDGEVERNVEFFTLLNEVLAVALNCGATRIATFSIDENNQGLTFTSRAALGEDWHNNVAHQASGDEAARALVRDSNRVFFSRVYLDLVARLDRFADGAGGTLLDHCLVAWGQESGNVTHWPFSMPVVTAGSAGGAMRTGSYCDYRNLDRRWGGDSSTRDESEFMWTGLVYNQWLTSALTAMGVPRDEWAEDTHPGYGARGSWPSDFYGFMPRPSAHYTDAIWARTGEMLPFLT